MYSAEKMLLVSSIARMIGNIIMIFSCNLFMVCASIAFYAISYNFSSGTGDALAYDSLKMAATEDYYEKYASNQMIIYRLCSGISTLCAGFALLIGHKAAYSSDILMGIIQIRILISLSEVYTCHPDTNREKNMFSCIKKELVTCFLESLSFLRKAKQLLVSLCSSWKWAALLLRLVTMRFRLEPIRFSKTCFRQNSVRL